MHSPAFPPESGISLVPRRVAGVELDICEISGGIWFDAFELQHFDEADEPAGELLMDLPFDPSAQIDFDMKRFCPRHPDVVMMQRPFGFRGTVVIDECPQCGGIWLDKGELKLIRELYPSQKEKEEAAQAFIDQIVAAKTGHPPADPVAAADPQAESRGKRYASIIRFL